MLGAIAEGTTVVSDLLEGEDVLATCAAMRALGAKVTKENSTYVVKGVGREGLRPPNQSLDFGNAGTGSRLTMGLAGIYPFETHFVGDPSLSSRPMGRILDPLKKFGVEVLEHHDGKLPITLKGPPKPVAIHY